MTRIASFLWFASEAREAADFYVETIPDGRILSTTTLPADTPFGPPGSVETIAFTLCGQTFIAMKAGPFEGFNHAFSISVELDTQDEIDRIWNAFLDNGGTAEQCGWLRDRWGLNWQIVPRRLADMIASPDRAAARRAAEAMLTMVKLDLPRLEAAFAGTA